MEALNEPAALTANEEALDTLSLEGFNRVRDETLSLTDRLMGLMGLETDPVTGNLVQMSAEDRLANLPDEERLLFTGLNEQIERQNALLAGDVAPSLALQKRGQTNFNALQEDQARRGNTITGNTINEGAGSSTSGIQALSALRSEQNTAIDNERRGDIAALDTSIRNRTGLLNNLQNNRISNTLNIPARHNITGVQNNAGLLRNVNFEADQQQAFNLDSGIAGLIGRLIP